MLGVAWSDLVAGGFFIAGLGLGVVITLRVGRMVGRFLVEMRDEADPKTTNAPPPSEDGDGA